MDDVAEFNKKRWDELSAAEVKYSVPLFDLDERTARHMIDPEGQLYEINGQSVLCLAASGGQQSAAFGVLGARVTVFDISDNQLAKDRRVASHYGFECRTIQGDMQDLSVFSIDEFDLVWLAHSINFVPDVGRVIEEIGRISRSKGRARINFTNPYVHGVWNRPAGAGFLLCEPYVDGRQMEQPDPYWHFLDPDGNERSVEGPKEFRHSLSTIINQLVANQLGIDGLWETIGTEPNAPKGSWEHFKTIAPPWLTIWATNSKKPENTHKTAR